MKRALHSFSNELRVDALYKSLNDTNYKAINITNEAFSILSAGNRAFFRNKWINLARKQIITVNIKNTRQLYNLSIGFDKIVEKRLVKFTRLWRYKAKWRMFNRYLKKNNFETQIKNQIPELIQIKHDERQSKWIKLSKDLMHLELTNSLIDGANEVSEQNLVFNSFNYWKSELKKRVDIHISRQNAWHYMVDSYLIYKQNKFIESYINNKKCKSLWLSFTQDFVKLCKKEALNEAHSTLVHTYMWRNAAYNYLFKVRTDNLYSAYERSIQFRKWNNLVEMKKKEILMNNLHNAKFHIELTKTFQNLYHKVVLNDLIKVATKAKSDLDKENEEKGKEDLVKRLFFMWRRKQTSRTVSKRYIRKAFRESFKAYGENLAINSAVCIQRFYRRESNRIDYNRSIKRKAFTIWKRIYSKLAKQMTFLPKVSVVVNNGADFSLSIFKPSISLEIIENVSSMHSLATTIIDNKVTSIALASSRSMDLFIPENKVSMKGLFNTESNYQLVNALRKCSSTFVDNNELPLSIDFSNTVTSIIESSTRNICNLYNVEVFEKPQVDDELIEEIGDSVSMGLDINFVLLDSKSLKCVSRDIEPDVLDGYDNYNLFNICFEQKEVVNVEVSSLLTLSKIEIQRNVDCVEETVYGIDFFSPLEHVSRSIRTPLKCLPCFTQSEDRKQEIDESVIEEAIEKFNLNIFDDEIKNPLEKNTSYINRLEKENFIIYDRSVHNSAAIMLDIESVFNEIFIPSTDPLAQLTQIPSNIDDLVEIDEERIESDIMSIISPENFELSINPINRYKHEEYEEKEDELDSYSLDLNLDDLAFSFKPLENIKPVGERNLDTMNVEEMITKDAVFENEFYIFKYYKLIKNFVRNEPIKSENDDKVEYSVDFDFDKFEDMKEITSRIINNVESNDYSEKVIKNVLSEVNSSADNTEYNIALDLHDITLSNNVYHLENVAVAEIPELLVKEVYDESLFDEVKIDTYIKETANSFETVTKTVLYENIDPEYDFDISFNTPNANINSLLTFKPVEVLSEAHIREANEASMSYLVELPQFRAEFNIGSLMNYQLFNEISLIYNPQINSNLFKEILDRVPFNHLDFITKVSIPQMEISSFIYEKESLEITFDNNENPLLHLSFKEPLPERDIKLSDIGIDDITRTVVTDIFGVLSNDFACNTKFIDIENDKVFLEDSLNEALANSINFCFIQEEKSVNENICRQISDKRDEETIDKIVNSLFDDFLDELICNKIEQKEDAHFELNTDFMSTLLDNSLENSLTKAITLNESTINNAIFVYNDSNEQNIDISEYSKLLDDAFSDSIKNALTLNREFNNVCTNKEEIKEELQHEESIVEYSKETKEEQKQEIDNEEKEEEQEKEEITEEEEKETIYDIADLEKSLLDSMEKSVITSVINTLDCIDRSFDADIEIDKSPRPSFRNFFNLSMSSLLSSSIISIVQNEILPIKKLGHKVRGKNHEEKGDNIEESRTSIEINAQTNNEEIVEENKTSDAKDNNIIEDIDKSITNTLLNTVKEQIRLSFGLFDISAPSSENKHEEVFVKEKTDEEEQKEAENKSEEVIEEQKTDKIETEGEKHDENIIKKEEEEEEKKEEETVTEMNPEEEKHDENTIKTEGEEEEKKEEETVTKKKPEEEKDNIMEDINNSLTDAVMTTVKEQITLAFEIFISNNSNSEEKEQEDSAEGKQIESDTHEKIQENKPEKVSPEEKEEEKEEESDKLLTLIIPVNEVINSFVLHSIYSLLEANLGAYPKLKSLTKCRKQKEEIPVHDVLFNESDFAQLFSNTLNRSIGTAISSVNSVFIPQNSATIKFEEKKEEEENIEDAKQEIILGISDFNSLFDTALDNSISFSLLSNANLFISRNVNFKEEEEEEEVLEETQVEPIKVDNICRPEIEEEKETEKRESNDFGFDQLFTDAINKSVDCAIQQQFDACMTLISVDTFDVEPKQQTECENKLNETKQIPQVKEIKGASEDYSTFISNELSNLTNFVCSEEIYSRVDSILSADFGKFGKEHSNKKDHKEKKAEEDESLDVTKDMEKLLNKAMFSSLQYNVSSTSKDINESLFVNEPENVENKEFLDSFFIDILDEIPEKLEVKRVEQETITITDDYESLFTNALKSSINSAIAIPDISYTVRKEEEKPLFNESVYEEMNSLLTNAFITTSNNIHSNILNFDIVAQSGETVEESDYSSIFEPIFNEAINKVEKRATRENLEIIGDLINNYSVNNSKNIESNVKESKAIKSEEIVEKPKVVKNIREEEIPFDQIFTEQINKSVNEASNSTFSMLMNFINNYSLNEEEREKIPKIVFKKEDITPFLTNSFNTEISSIISKSVISNAKNIDIVTSIKPKSNHHTKHEKEVKHSSKSIKRTPADETINIRDNINGSFEAAIGNTILSIIRRINIDEIAVEKESNSIISEAETSNKNYKEHNKVSNNSFLSLEQLNQSLEKSIKKSVNSVILNLLESN